MTKRAPERAGYRYSALLLLGFSVLAVLAACGGKSGSDPVANPFNLDAELTRRHQIVESDRSQPKSDYFADLGSGIYGVALNSATYQKPATSAVWTADETGLSTLDKLFNSRSTAMKSLPLAGLGFSLQKRENSQTWQRSPSLAISGVDWKKTFDFGVAYGREVYFQNKLIPAASEVAEPQTFFYRTTGFRFFNTVVDTITSTRDEWTAIDTTAPLIEGPPDAVLSLWEKVFTYGRIFLGHVSTQEGTDHQESLWLGILGEATPFSANAMVSNSESSSAPARNWRYYGLGGLFVADTALDPVNQESFLLDIHFNPAGAFSFRTAELFYEYQDWTYSFDNKVPFDLPSKSDGRPFSLTLGYKGNPLRSTGGDGDSITMSQKLDFSHATLAAAFFGPEHNILAGFVHLKSMDDAQHFFGTFYFPLTEYIP